MENRAFDEEGREEVVGHRLRSLCLADWHLVRGKPIGIQSSLLMSSGSSQSIYYIKYPGDPLLALFMLIRLVEIRKLLKVFESARVN